ncbi:MAG TPA: dephospho-CoA kinase [Candidatus Eisenbergiella merdipullorum]|uniref:Dephospho-CoA kinase n=1 Tax=Candidatus Eisenbergiella merdipullorum TaxID=2838553 RepID=A0A9D2I7R9_9FIRM|nr:dephospho-CoA kinase [Candidatus Eisenbergiella merdipullorum]
MKLIGITGGVGAGKTRVLELLKELCCCRILLADEVGNEVKLPGQPCYERLVELLGKQVLSEDGTIDKKKMAGMIFADPALLDRVNEIIHPEVKRYILEQVGQERERGDVEYFFLEAALLIECGYEAVLDEIWYIHADESVRAARLKESRGYSDEKIRQIFESQLSEEEFRRHCSVVIENNGDLKETKRQLQAALRRNGAADGPDPAK